MVCDLAPNALLHRTRPEFGGRAAETRNIVPFVVEQLEAHKASTGESGKLVLAAGKALSGYYSMLKDHGRRLPQEIRLHVRERPTIIRRFAAGRNRHKLAGTKLARG